MNRKLIFFATLFVSSLSLADSQPNVASCSADNVDLIYRESGAQGKASVYYVGAGYDESKNVRIVVADNNRIKIDTTATSQTVSVDQFDTTQEGNMNISFVLPRVTYAENAYDATVSTVLTVTRQSPDADVVTMIPVDCVVSTVKF